MFGSWLALVALGGLLAPPCLATVRVVPAPKAETPVRPSRAADAPPQSRDTRDVRQPSAADESGSRCLEELSQLSLGVDNRSAAERLRRQDCR